MAKRSQKRETRTATGDRPGVVHGILRWAPVWIPLCLFAQVALLGLRPALAEGRRLEREEKILEERWNGVRQEWELLQRESHALDDEVYRERIRKSWLDPERGALGH